jgi:quercetin dioxygenase-like cupin family protein
MFHFILRPRAAVGETRALFLAISLLVLGGAGLLAGGAANAQDPVKVDAKHYKVEFENDSVRVLRITYPAHEKSVMHHHPANVAVFLTDGKARFTLPDGKTQDAPVKAGSAQWSEAGEHLPENVGDKPFELILVELKTKKAPAK